jgi:hypothetical protein
VQRRRKLKGQEELGPNGSVVKNRALEEWKDGEE